MDVSEYRKQVESELEKATKKQATFRDLLEGAPRKRSKGSRRQSLAATVAPPPDGDDLTAALGVLRDPAAGEHLRSAALQVIATNIDERPDLIDSLVEILKDGTVATDQRLAVLNLLQQISFRIAHFPGKRPELMEGLRSVVDAPDAELRRRVIGVLAREKDEYVQRRLVEGLEGTAKALVPAAKAVQFLGYDVHAEHFPLLRRIVADPPSQTARKEALRLLAADPSSADLLLRILRDRNEKADVRRICAIALQSLDPERLEAEARRILMNDDEDDQLRALSLNTLTHFGNPAALTEDQELGRRVERLRGESRSRQLKQASAAFMAKHPT